MLCISSGAVEPKAAQRRKLNLLYPLTGFLDTRAFCGSMMPIASNSRARMQVFKTRTIWSMPLARQAAEIGSIFS